MALLSEDHTSEFQQRLEEDTRDYLQRVNDAFENLARVSLALPEGRLTGALVSFPCDGGLAHYRVVIDIPLTLEHIPVPGSTQLGADAIARVERADLLLQLQQQRALARLFQPSFCADRRESL